MGVFPVSTYQTFEAVSPAFLGFLSFALFIPPAHHGCIPTFHLSNLWSCVTCFFGFSKLCSINSTCTCQSSTLKIPSCDSYLWNSCCSYIVFVKQLLLLHSIRIQSFIAFIMTKTFAMGVLRRWFKSEQWWTSVWLKSNLGPSISAIPVPCLNRKVLVPRHWYWGRSGQCGASAERMPWMLSLAVCVHTFVLRV